MSQIHSEKTLLKSRYEVLSKVGEGAYSVVYLAKDKYNPKTRWAIKQIRRDNLTYEEDKELREMFLKEVNVLSQLNHPRLPKVLTGNIDRRRAAASGQIRRRGGG